MTTDRDELRRPVELGDLDACIRTVDGIVTDRDWESLLWFADVCRAACERGFQLWPAAEYALARAALDAPGDVAGQTLFESTIPVGLGPRAEIAASSHTWAELAPSAPYGPVATLALHERVVRGEDLRGLADDALPGPMVIDLPRALEAWEPDYALATYRADRVEVLVPARPGDAAMVAIAPGAADALDDEDTEHVGNVLRATTRAWVAETDVRTRAVGVEGGLEDAVRALVGPRAPARLAPISGADALAHLAWIAASGGPEGRRRGAAIGRADAWHIAALLGGLDLDDGLDAAGVGGVVNDLAWAWWDDATMRGEWSVGLAIADPLDGLAWALDVC